MRYVLPLFAIAAGAMVVIACSSDDPKPANGPGSIAPLGDGGGADDDDDTTNGDAGCSGMVKSLDCTAQAAHAKEANCSHFDEKTFKEDCEAQNCGTTDNCAPQLRAYGDCLLAQPAQCTSDGDVSSDTPAACQGQAGAVFSCSIQM